MKHNYSLLGGYDRHEVRVACEHILTHIISKRLDDTSDEVYLTIKCDDCGEIGETSVDLDAVYERNAERINWANGDD